MIQSLLGRGKEKGKGKGRRRRGRIIRERREGRRRMKGGAEEAGTARGRAVPAVAVVAAAPAPRKEVSD